VAPADTRGLLTFGTLLNDNVVLGYQVLNLLAVQFNRLRDPHNSTFLPTHSLPKHSRNSAQRDNLQNSTHYPHVAPTCVMAEDTSQAAKKGRSGTNSQSTKSERTSNSATAGPHTPSSGLHIEQQSLQTRIRSAHLLYSAMTGYPLVFGITATASQRIPARNASSSKQRDACTSATLEHFGAINSSISLRNTS
jgi:hypothetical protein